MKALRQSRPIVYIHQEGKRGFIQRFLELGVLKGRDLLQIRAAQHQVQVAAIVTLSVNTTSIGPYLGPWQVLACQILYQSPVPEFQMQNASHRLCLQ